MALVFKDRIKETTTTTGQGTITLAGAVNGFRSFADVGNSNTTYYVISDNSAYTWEVGIGIYTASGTTLSRDTVLQTSAGNTTRINFGAGSKEVFVSSPADKHVYLDGSGDLTVDGTTYLNAIHNRWTKTATDNQTIFTGSDNSGATLSVSAHTQVFINGILLEASDYTVGGTTTVTLGSGASTSDIVEIISFAPFTTASALQPSNNLSDVSSASTARTNLGLGDASTKTVGIGSGNVGTFAASVADNDFLKIDGTTIEGRSSAEVLSDIGGQASLTFGIANTNAVKVDHASVADNDYAKFTSTGVEGMSYAEVKTDLSLNNVENTAISTWAGSSNVTTVGTVTSGTISTGAVLADVTMTLGSDADGDVYYRASNKLARLAKGTAGKVLAMNSGATAPEWANAYVHPNHTGEVTSTADGATVIADNIVDEANLKVSNAPTNGYFLSAQSGNTGGLTWAEVASGGSGVSSSVTITDVKVWSLPKGFSLRGTGAQNVDGQVTRPSTGMLTSNTYGNSHQDQWYWSIHSDPTTVMRSGGYTSNTFTNHDVCNIYTNHDSNQPITDVGMSFFPWEVDSADGSISLGQSGLPTMYQPDYNNTAAPTFTRANTNIVGVYGGNNYVFQCRSSWKSSNGTQNGMAHFYLNTDNTHTNQDRMTDHWDFRYDGMTSGSYAWTDDTKLNRSTIRGADSGYLTTSYALPTNAASTTTDGLWVCADNNGDYSSSWRASTVTRLALSATANTDPTHSDVTLTNGSTTGVFHQREGGWKNTSAYNEMGQVSMISQFGYYVDVDSNNTEGYNLPTSVFWTHSVPSPRSDTDYDNYARYLLYYGGLSNGTHIKFQTAYTSNDPQSSADNLISGFGAQGGKRHSAQGGGASTYYGFHLIGSDSSSPDPCIMVYNIYGQAIKITGTSGYTGTSTSRGSGKPTVYTPNYAPPVDIGGYASVDNPQVYSIPGSRDTFFAMRGGGNLVSDTYSSMTLEKFSINSANAEVTSLGWVDLGPLMSRLFPPAGQQSTSIVMHPIYKSSASTWSHIAFVIKAPGHQKIVTIDFPTFVT